jgi:tetratricopeptide (TPR) repeat protein
LLYATRYPAWAGYADVLANRSPEGLARALKLEPANAVYWEAASVQLPVFSIEYRAAIESALRNDPHNSRLWMKLGDSAAIGGEPAKAETAYKEAAKFNRGYDPHWLLANLYFRQGDSTKFWTAIRPALAFDSRDLGAAFDLCWSVSQDAARILEAVPPTPKILARYLDYLLQTNRLEESAAVAAELLKSPEAEEAPTLLNYSDRLIAGKRYHDAYEVWSALARRSLAAPNGGASNLISNSGLTQPFTGRGFDWRWEAPGNVNHIQIPNLNQVEFQFDGNQPEKCDLMRQLLWLEPGSAYRFTFDYRTLDIEGHSGLRWRIADVDGSEIQVSEEMASLAWKTSVMLLRVPRQSQGQQLILGYERPRGTTRIAGSLSVRTPVLQKVD